MPARYERKWAATSDRTQGELTCSQSSRLHCRGGKCRATCPPVLHAVVLLVHVSGRARARCQTRPGRCDARQIKHRAPCWYTTPTLTMVIRRTVCCRRSATTLGNRFRFGLPWGAYCMPSCCAVTTFVACYGKMMPHWPTMTTMRAYLIFVNCVVDAIVRRLPGNNHA